MSHREEAIRYLNAKIKKYEDDGERDGTVAVEGAAIDTAVELLQLQSHLDKAGITDASKLGDMVVKYDTLCDYAEHKGMNVESLTRFRGLHVALTKKG